MSDDGRGKPKHDLFPRCQCTGLDCEALGGAANGTWTERPPENPGWYWVRDRYAGPYAKPVAAVVRVQYDPDDGGLCAVDGDAVPMPVEVLKCEWSGPLKEPAPSLWSILEANERWHDVREGAAPAPTAPREPAEE